MGEVSKELYSVQGEVSSGDTVYGISVWFKNVIQVGILGAVVWAILSAYPGMPLLGVVGLGVAVGLIWVVAGDL